MDFPLQWVRPSWEKNISRPTSVRVIPLVNTAFKWCMCVAGSKHLLNGLHQSPSSPLESSAEQNHTLGTRQVKPRRQGRFCYRRFFPVWPSCNLSSPPCFMATASRATGFVCSNPRALQGTLQQQSILWYEVEIYFFFNVVSDEYFTSPVRLALHSHQATIAHNRMQPLPLPRDCCRGVTLLKWFTGVIAMNMALIHITETPSAREISSQLRSGLQGCIVHHSSGFKHFASIQQEIEDKLKAFVF